MGALVLGSQLGLLHLLQLGRLPCEARLGRHLFNLPHPIRLCFNDHLLGLPQSLGSRYHLL